MNKIHLKDDAGAAHLGLLPEGWDEVPLAAYAALAAAETIPARIEATAALVGLPAQPMLDDTSLFAVIAEAAPWLFGDEMPEAEGAVPQFKHEGVIYRHVGHLDKINAEQLEALLTFLKAAEGHPLNCGPGLLAVLYCPAGQPQTREVVRASVAALASLPMSTAWPAISDFYRSSLTLATNIRTASALSEQLRGLLAEVERRLIPGGSTTFWQRVLRFLVAMWLRNAKKML